MESAPNRIPPLTSMVEEACFKCFKEDVTLSKCSSCKRVSYCGSVCQKADWTAHKKICKAITQTSVANLLVPSDAKSINATTLKELDNILTRNINSELGMIEKVLGRSVTVIERNLISMQPCCMTCTRTDRFLRSEGTISNSPKPALVPCPVCKLTFYCSEEHEKLAHPHHMVVPCDEGHDELTPCQINQELRTDINFSNAVGPAFSGGSFMWAPERVKPSWTPLTGIDKTRNVNTNWSDEFSEDIIKDIPLPSHASPVPWVRAASQQLSMPMTILWGLQNLKKSDDWTRQQTLTIHILGAAQKEVMDAQVFEEILHRLPAVKTLKLVLCGPELNQVFTTKYEAEMDMDPCPQCRASGRKRIHQHYFDTYHDLAKRLGSKLGTPDLAIAFNSGASEHIVGQSWLPTMKYLVDNKINSVFTSYNRDEAEAESKMLTQRANATLVSALNATLNPWGSVRLLKEQTKVSGYYSENRWIAGGI